MLSSNLQFAKEINAHHTFDNTTKPIYYDVYGYTHSPPKDNNKGEAQLRGNKPKRLDPILYYYIYKRKTILENFGIEIL